MILALVGCNQIYGLEATKGRDAAPKEFFDAPPDAPFTCPGDDSAPRFKPRFGQVPVGQCFAYTPSHDTKTAVAYCFGLGIAEGPIDGPLASTIPPGTRTLFDPRLFPEGDRMFIRDTTNGNRVDIYARQGTTWSATPFLTAVPNDWYVSNPSRGPDRRAIVLEYSPAIDGFVITEYVEQQPDAWTARPSYKLNTVNFGTHPSLSSDGLRMVFSTFTGVFYASRPTLADRFDKPIELTTLPNQASYVFLEDDCSRIYFSALETVLYLEQE